MVKEKTGMHIKGEIKVNYEWSLGKAGERFFTDSETTRRLWGPSVGSAVAFLSRHGYSVRNALSTTWNGCK